ncbi:hypothetical protein SADUNF_Sadunf14G0093300 [Salix dunnii]|uniref:Uncharacterized protein n=1 Tax=Salix dunnii TaxID=1413687 RepID=A0A835JEU8_9ROSI|nr:hypothetical protein SADUNF_Sadunf14G0093300 [Salix dunnii]
MALCKPTGNIEFALVSNSARIKDYQFAHYTFCPNMYNVDENENSDKPDVTSLMRGIQEDASHEKYCRSNRNRISPH